MHGVIPRYRAGCQVRCDVRGVTLRVKRQWSGLVVRELILRHDAGRADALRAHIERVHLAAGTRAGSLGSAAVRGASLVEVLVALGVLSVGLLGIGQVLVHGMRTTHSALLRTQAVNLVADMAERIRANPLGAAAYDCASYASAPEPRDCAAIDSARAPANCTAAELAEDDLARWQDAARAAVPLLPVACAADVRYEPGAVTDHFRVSLTWEEPGASQALSEHADVVIVRPAMAGRP